MKKTLLLITTLLLSILVLASCNEGEEVPEGLQIIEINYELGFRFYGPENWIVINASTGENTRIWGAKMSSANNISITLAKSEMPEGDIGEYFDRSLKEFPEGMTPYVVKSPTKANFGNAGEAYQCVYTYKYEDYNFACMQYFVKNGSDFYIFTYTSYGDVTDEESDYSVYYDDVMLAVDNFLFTEKKETADEDNSHEYDSDGYYLASDKKISGFSLYLPEECKLINSGAYVTASLPDGCSIYLGKATSTGIQINEYWNKRREELKRIATEVTEIEVNKINKDGEEISVVLGDLPENRVASYEFTYVIDGVKYHVYQVMGVDFSNGYVFTYTAPEEEYEKNLTTIRAILEKVKF